MNLRQKAAKGVVWSAIQSWGTRAISFLVFLALARLLEPESFGLVAMASVFTAFARIFLDQGFGDAIVQRAELEREHLDTTFWTGMLIGGLLTVGGIAMSGLVAEFFHEPQLAPIVGWLSLSFLFGALSSTQQAILRRRLAFKDLAARSLVAAVIGGIVGATMAFLGFGVWSLVAQNLVNGLVGAVVLWRVSDWRPGLGFSKKHFKELFTFGVSITGTKFLNFFNRRSDDLLIGYFLGPTALGYYTIAYRLLLVVTNLLTNIITPVALPMFSRLQNEPEWMHHAFYTAIQYASLISFPVFLGMSALAPELVPVLYGPKWAPSIPVMQILGFVGILYALFLFNGPIFKAVGKPSWHLLLTALQAVGNVVVFILVVRWGIVAVAAAYVIRGYLMSPISLWALHRLVHIKPTVCLRQCVGPLTGGLVMVVAVLGTKHLFSGSMSLHVLLAVQVVLGAVVYAVTILLIMPKLPRQSLHLIRLALPRLTRRSDTLILKLNSKR